MIDFSDFLPLRSNVDEISELKRISRAAGARWSARPGIRRLLDDLEQYGGGKSLDDCAILSSIFSDVDNAAAMISTWIGEFTKMAGENPLAQPDFGYQSSKGAATMQLARAGSAELSITCFEANDNSGGEPETARFLDCERHETVLAGSAGSLIARFDPAASPGGRISTKRQEVATGHLFHSVSRKVLRSRTYTRIDGRLVVLRLVRQPTDPQPTREIRLSDGMLVGQCSANRHESCQQVMMAALGRMDRKDAVPHIARIAREASEHLRWEAIRQCLALNAREGFALLCEASRNPADPLSGIACVLRSQLVEAHPQLAELEREPCLA